VRRYLTFSEVLALHQSIIERWGGSGGIRDLGALESALAQPRQGFGGADLYPDLASKAAALCFSLVLNHPFVDGNKRGGHAAMEAYLLMNGHELNAPVDEQEHIILNLAAGQLPRDALLEWLKQHISSAQQ
jgi:death-on-curing protein